MASSNEIREIFLSYFEEQGHQRVRSSSLVPKDDPTLLFTNAGMNQFKDLFLGLEKIPYNRATSSQKCMRVSGKHNDLESVGRTPRHHTFFEMLGNFSFGDYFKEEAIRFAWDLCTKRYSLDPSRLVITVFEEDQEAFDIWKKSIGVPEARIFRMGEEENFWSMGPTGPCGPCSEIHFDWKPKAQAPTLGEFASDSDRFLEIWNLVFMQFNRDGEGRMSSLPSPSIDTGMGLERITSVVQGVESNYLTDLFLPLIEEAARLSNVSTEDETKQFSLRVLADHSRACAFLIHDGVVPSNEGRGYVLRKILRRAIRHVKLLGFDEPMLYQLTKKAAELSSSAYPELASSSEYASQLVRTEEEQFSSTLSHGVNRLEELIHQASQKTEETLSGSEIFKLYDTFGFPVDLAREIALERGFQIDEAGFEAEMEEQRQRARAHWKGAPKMAKPVHEALLKEDLETVFTGYDEISEVDGRILAMVTQDRRTDALEAGESGEIILDRSPFYAESGGQVADRGLVRGASSMATVEDVQSPFPGLRLHRIRVQEGKMRVNDSVSSTVAAARREDTARNHTATHLFHAALREVLGEHVRQAGSLVEPDRLRFDFTHFSPLTGQEVRRIEELVNEKIRQNLEVFTETRNLEDALEEGAMALFGEKYQNRVRVVKVPGYSVELCGGTHVTRTGDIALFKIVAEGSISAGARRAEATTGQVALERFFENEEALSRVAASIQARKSNLLEAVEGLLAQSQKNEKELEKLRFKLLQIEAKNYIKNTLNVKGVQVLTRRIEEADPSALRNLADQLRQQLGSGIVILGLPSSDKVSLVAMVSSDLTNRIRADVLIKELAPMLKGGGGGRAEMAEAGGKDPSRLDEVLKKAPEVIEGYLAGES